MLASSPPSRRVRGWNTGVPWAWAAVFTGGGVSTCLRPTGLSRRVYTPQISWPAAYSASRQDAAMSGVPMNKIRIYCSFAFRASARPSSVSS